MCMYAYMYSVIVSIKIALDAEVRAIFSQAHSQWLCIGLLKRFNECIHTNTYACICVHTYIYSFIQKCYIILLTLVACF